ncbi:MAG: hypothetical protein P9X22_00535 [Candidatus Zapsychrus exili]|nr:hypothetical protein [Candidatus Zapsychrus exili]
MNINIDTIQKEINQLFDKYKIPAITKNLPIKNLQVWSKNVAIHFKLDEKNFRQTVTELFWSMGHVQLSLGHMLIALQECEFIDGIQGIALHEKDVPNIKMPEIYFWYYVYTSHECVYRCWERINNVLMHVCFPNLSEKQFRKQYFSQTISALHKNSRYTQNPYLEELQKYIEYRKKAADDRNEISHGKSSPMRNMKIEGKVSNSLGANGLPFIYLDYSCKSLSAELDNVIDKYKKVLPTIKAMKDFIDNIE